MVPDEGTIAGRGLGKGDKDNGFKSSKELIDQDIPEYMYFTNKEYVYH